MDQDINNILLRYREGGISLTQLRAWLDQEQARVGAQIPRGPLLKLKRGSEAMSMDAIAKLLPACLLCVGIGEPKQFVSRTEYQQYSKRRDAAVANGVLIQIPPPPYPVEGKAATGAAGYYRCAQCGSVWVFVEPERAENGSWHRVA